jgi:hypothetical protein
MFVEDTLRALVGDQGLAKELVAELDGEIEVAGS